MSKIVDKWWFSSYSGNLGIVKVYDEITQKNKFYIGKTLGINEEADAEHIKQYGAKFFPEMIR